MLATEKYGYKSIIEVFLRGLRYGFGVGKSRLIAFLLFGIDKQTVVCYYYFVDRNNKFIY